MTYAHPRLEALIAQARDAQRQTAPTIGIVYPCDSAALDAARRIADSGIARPVLIGPTEAIARAADASEIDLSTFEIVATGTDPHDASQHATSLARDGALAALMKGSLHTDELMSAVVNKTTGLRGDTRISHAFVFDLPRYPKLLALADCVVNISPDLRTKRDILGNAVRLLQALGIAQPKVGIVAAVETVNPAIPATVDAQALVELSRQGEWPGAIVEGPFGFDNAISAEAARIKGIASTVSGDADLLLMPDLNAGNMLYKSFVYVGGGDCAGLVLGARVPIVLTSRADSLQSRLASVALAVLAVGNESARPGLAPSPSGRGLG
ncbi:bifunctional enoyl-CoA hydratase/phosphate acetyltransferase [Methylibium sp.]|uniref:bifunctional enoyl-CoA hydratase/phosphate acetyltransferase n=1 Tax=Methylibium sp. TaxID=2067992 RepID=UPI0017BE8D7F|nr:bifunctional enoyl-CoA hydratase/phosphate acetyltransferase [Methylibium sp.]MBA3591528.1 bifunctional enoyl-CoA hydratase/phosphate acetyltransferase [Methylibium sp.]